LPSPSLELEPYQALGQVTIFVKNLFLA